MTTAICAWLRRRGWRVAPFKAQNMSNNSFPCAAGGEVGRAQVAQAEACGLEAHPDFNPILLKPDTDQSSQVVVNGRVWKSMTAREYYQRFPELLQVVLDAHARLTGQYEVVVMEGAGSVTEMNLRHTDLVNFGLASRVEAPALLVSDIDRGGVFAQITGTSCLLPPEDRRWLRSFAVNRFRGDRELFHDGVTFLENKTKLPCLGVFPFARHIHLDEEDGVSLEDRRRNGGSRIAILALPRISNLTDFRLISDCTIVDRVIDGRFDAVILPGTKATEEDLDWLREQSLDHWIAVQYALGAKLIGICGGYQMLGQRVGRRMGLGYLPVETDFAADKITVAVTAELPDGHRFPAYEIRMGRTSIQRNADATPFAYVDGQPEGIRCGRVTGTYLHGALEDPVVLSGLLGGTYATPPARTTEYAKLADWFEANANIQQFEELYLCA